MASFVDRAQNRFNFRVHLFRWSNGRVRAKLRSKFGGYFRNPIEHRDYVAAGAAAGRCRNVDVYFFVIIVKVG